MFHATEDTQHNLGTPKHLHNRTKEGQLPPSEGICARTFLRSFRPRPRKQALPNNLQGEGLPTFKPIARQGVPTEYIVCLNRGEGIKNRWIVDTLAPKLRLPLQIPDAHSSFLPRAWLQLCREAVVLGAVPVVTSLEPKVELLYFTPGRPSVTRLYCCLQTCLSCSNLRSMCRRHFSHECRRWQVSMVTGRRRQEGEEEEEGVAEGGRERGGGGRKKCVGRRRRRRKKQKDYRRSLAGTAIPQRPANGTQGAQRAKTQRLLCGPSGNIYIHYILRSIYWLFRAPASAHEVPRDVLCGISRNLKRVPVGAPAVHRAVPPARAKPQLL